MLVTVQYTVEEFEVKVAVGQHCKRWVLVVEYDGELF